MGNAVLAEPLTLGQEKISRSTLCSGKAFLVIPLLTGFVLAVLFSSLHLTSSEVESTAVNMRGMSCPRSGPTMPVSVMQNTLQKYGVPPSPLEKFAAYAATRDVSM